MASTPSRADHTPKRRMWRGIPPEERDAARLERLLEAGLRVFGSKGYSGSSVEGICTEAGVSTRSFYEHFEDREALLIEVYDRIIAEVFAAVDEALASEPENLESWCRGGIAAAMHALLDDERKARINCVEVVGVSQHVEKHRRTAGHKLSTQMFARAEPLVAAGVIRPMRWTPIALVGAFTQVLVEWLEQPDRDAFEAMLDELAKVWAAALTA